ncbi:farnesyl pyrophosphate synthase isoform X2 [Solenopsis invicta]|uniref:farnesyl pyrophosphate synthase isoform X2 n=1 Tax=Solenopsis invicta TaxID=13686 RepID=UPI000E33DA8D|nr:farnesyl pyrophosphate synthase isoform X2 [Solenopsis invicta]
MANCSNMAQISKEENREMMAIWPDIVQDITEAARNLNIPDVAKWMEKMQTYILVLDDIQDHSLLRRGQPCWHLYSNVGEAAVNDGVLLESAMYYIIRKHFKGKECYVNLVETFQDIIFKTLMGQCMDLYSSNFGKKPNLDLFTIDRHNTIIEIKTAYYTYVLPTFAAMHFAGIKNPEMFRQAKIIALEIGHMFQVQDDYLDCFGDTEICGKNGIDIQDGKCTWLIVVALQRATFEQRKILEECYGVADPEKIKRVKKLFIDLDLPKIYSIYEEEKYNMTNTRIQQISCGLPQSIFFDLLRTIYHRTS